MHTSLDDGTDTPSALRLPAPAGSRHDTGAAGPVAPHAGQATDDLGPGRGDEVVQLGADQ